MFSHFGSHLPVHSQFSTTSKLHRLDPEFTFEYVPVAVIASLKTIRQQTSLWASQVTLLTCTRSFAESWQRRHAAMDSLLLERWTVICTRWAALHFRHSSGPKQTQAIENVGGSAAQLRYPRTAMLCWKFNRVWCSGTPHSKSGQCTLKPIEVMWPVCTKSCASFHIRRYPFAAIKERDAVSWSCLVQVIG